MALTPQNPYIPGDPYSYDLKWMVQKVKENISIAQTAVTDAQTAITNAASATATAGQALSAANTAASNAAAALETANAAAASAESAAAAAAEAAAQVADLYTITNVPPGDFIDTERTTANIVDSFAYRIGPLLFFRIYANGIGSGTRQVYFKSPYNRYTSVVQWPLVEQSSATSQYDTFRQMILPAENQFGAQINFTDFTSTHNVVISGILILDMNE